MNSQIEKSRELRKNMTSQERKLWNIIRNRQFFGYRFRRQFPIGEYIVDFICREKKIIIEIDGGQHNEKQNIEYDNKRTEYLNSEGYQVVRFWNSEIDGNVEGVYEQLKVVFGISSITPTQPSPSREGVRENTPSQLSPSREGVRENTPSQPSPSREGVQKITQSKLFLSKEGGR